MDTNPASTQPLSRPPQPSKRRVSFAEAPIIPTKTKEVAVDSESGHDKPDPMEKKDKQAIKVAAGGWEIERSIYKKKVGSRSKGEESRQPAASSSNEIAANPTA